jgi:hypothetical protein
MILKIMLYIEYQNYCKTHENIFIHFNLEDFDKFLDYVRVN